MASEGEVLENFDDDFDMSAFAIDESADIDEENIDSGESPGDVETEEVASEDEISTDETTSDEDDSDDTSGDGEANTSPGELYSSLADNMRERGILASLDPEKFKDIKDIDSLMNAFNEELSAREYSDLSDKQKVYLKALRDGIPQEEVTEYIKISDQLNGITADEIDSNEELRKALIKEQYKIVNNMSEEKAERLAQVAIDTGEDIADAKEALESLKAKQSQEFEAQLAAKQQDKVKAAESTKAVIEGFKKKIDESKHIFEGLEINKTEKEKLFNQMTSSVGTSQDGRPIDIITKARMDNPEDFTLKLHYLFMQTDGFKNINKFIKTSKTKAANSLDQVLRNQANQPGASGRMVVNDQESDFSNLGKIL